MTVEIRPSKVRNSPKPSEEYVRLEQKQAIQRFNRESGVTLTDSNVRQKEVELVVTIDRHSSDWPQY